MNTRTTKKAPFGVLFLNEVCLAAREVTLRVVKLLRSEVPASVGGTLHFTLCAAQCFTAASPLLPLAKPNFTNYGVPVLFVKLFCSTNRNLKDSKKSRE